MVYLGKFKGETHGIRITFWVDLTKLQTCRERPWDRPRRVRLNCGWNSSRETGLIPIICPCKLSVKQEEYNSSNVIESTGPRQIVTRHRKSSFIKYW